MKSLALQKVPRDAFKAYISVNNPRIWAMAAEVTKENPEAFTKGGDQQKLQLLQEGIARRYEAVGETVSDAEQTAPDLQQQGAFFEQNPLLVKGLVDDIRRLKLSSLEAVVAHIEASLPELFAPRQEYFDATKERLDQTPQGRINATNWIHVQESIDHFKRFVGNLQASGELRTYPKDVREVLTQEIPVEVV